MMGTAFIPVLLLFLQVCGLGGGRDTNLRTNYYTHGSSPAPGDPPLDYHLSPSSNYLTRSADSKIFRSTRDNITTHLGASVALHCDIVESIGVSWTKFTDDQSNPIALSFNNQVFVTDSRISVETVDSLSILRIRHVKETDQGIYSCHQNSNNKYIQSFPLTVQVPNVTMLDGFGRYDRSHFYKVGSSLEVICQIEMWNLPVSWRTENLTEFVIWEKNGMRVQSNPKQFRKRIMTEIEKENIVSRLAITQASKSDSGNYSCTIPNFRRTTIRLFIMEVEEPEQEAILNLGGQLTDSLGIRGQLTGSLLSGWLAASLLLSV